MIDGVFFLTILRFLRKGADDGDFYRLDPNNRHNATSSSSSHSQQNVNSDPNKKR